MLRECPHCKAIYEIDEKQLGEMFRCPGCGRLFRPPRPFTTICPDCGNIISRKSFFCPHCGRWRVASGSRSLMVLSFWLAAAAVPLWLMSDGYFLDACLFTVFLAAAALLTVFFRR